MTSMKFYCCLYRFCFSNVLSNVFSAFCVSIISRDLTATESAGFSCILTFIWFSFVGHSYFYLFYSNFYDSFGFLTFATHHDFWTFHRRFLPGFIASTSERLLSLNPFGRLFIERFSACGILTLGFITFCNDAVLLIVALDSSIIYIISPSSLFRLDSYFWP